MGFAYHVRPKHVASMGLRMAMMLSCSSQGRVCRENTSTWSRVPDDMVACGWRMSCGNVDALIMFGRSEAEHSPFNNQFSQYFWKASLIL
jgi:hypothetical protein